MKYELNKFHRNTSDEELLGDVKQIAQTLGKESLTIEEYEELGKFCSGTLKDRYGSWNLAIQQAGLKPKIKIKISQEELFRNLQEVWTSLHRQPLSREMKRPLSQFSTEPYVNRYGTFRNALKAFSEHANSDQEQIPKEEQASSVSVQIPKPAYKHRTKRNIPERLKTLVLIRDGNKCRICGTTVTEENIHVDHIKPWSRGGETEYSNLQIVCEKHNLLKGNAEIEKDENRLVEGSFIVHQGIIFS